MVEYKQSMQVEKLLVQYFGIGTRKNSEELSVCLKTPELILINYFIKWRVTDTIWVCGNGI